MATMDKHLHHLVGELASNQLTQNSSQIYQREFVSDPGSVELVSNSPSEKWYQALLHTDEARLDEALGWMADRWGKQSAPIQQAVDSARGAKPEQSGRGTSSGDPAAESVPEESSATAGQPNGPSWIPLAGLFAAIAGVLVALLIGIGIINDGDDDSDTAQKSDEEATTSTTQAELGDVLSPSVAEGEADDTGESVDAEELTDCEQLANEGSTRMDYREADLSSCALPKSVNLRGMDFTRANASGMQFNTGVHDGADFTRANLTGADIAYGSYEDVILDGANLTGAHLHNGGFSGTSLVGANLADVRFDNFNPCSRPMNWTDFVGTPRNVDIPDDCGFPDPIDLPEGDSLPEIGTADSGAALQQVIDAATSACASLTAADHGETVEVAGLVFEVVWAQAHAEKRDRLENENGGFDAFVTGDGPFIIVGSAGGDNLTSHEASDVLCGNGGDDILNGKDGNDLLIGGDGADTIKATAGLNVLVGDDDDLELTGGAEIDWCSDVDKAFSPCEERFETN